MRTDCSHELLESALAGNLSAHDENVLGNHLESCEACNSALEQMAGGPQWCREAASLLASDELDATAPSSTDKWSEIDFTVEHLEPSDDPAALGRLGGYDVLAVIGQGGMGIVLKGYDRELKRLVAIKVLAPHLAQSPLAKKRFAREAQAAAAVVHPNVLAIHQVQPTGRLPFLVMPLVAGQSLAERLAAQGMLELKEILRIAMQAAAGLAAAHEQGLVHRDVKPANILLEKGIERAVLTDFGLARAADDVTLTRFGIIAGTPQYMSPEQARGEPLDGRSDLFSLGCVMYEMATGISPFKSDSMLATMRRLVDDAPQAMEALNPELPPWFIAIVNRLLEKDASRRFASAKQLSELLEGCLAHVQQPAHVPLPGDCPDFGHHRCGGRPGEQNGTVPLLRAARSLTSRRPRWLTAIATLLLALGGTVAFMAATSEPSDISGQWTGEDRGTITLKQTTPGEYEGTYTETVGKDPGKITLKWSRIQRQYSGDWNEGKTRYGTMEVHQVGDEIRGAWTTDRKSKVNAPALADLTWTRPTAHPVAGEAANWTFGPEISRKIGSSPNNRDGYLRLADGETMAVSPTFWQPAELLEWLDKERINLTAIYHKDTQRWEIKLRNAKFAEIPDKNRWKEFTAGELQRTDFKWMGAGTGLTDQDENGFRSLTFRQLRAPMYAFETSDGRRGLLLFMADSHTEWEDTITVRYKLLQKTGDAQPPLKDSPVTFGPRISRELRSMSNKQGRDALRLEDGRVFNLPGTPASGDEGTELAPDEFAKWLDRNKINFAIDYLKDADQWELKLRNVKFAELPSSDTEAMQVPYVLERRFGELKWPQTAQSQAEQKEKGFYSLRFIGGLNPPRYVFETVGGHRGILWFVSQTAGDKSQTIHIDYKLLQRSKDRVVVNEDGGNVNAAPEAVNLHFGPVIEQTLNDISVERNALPPPALNLETGEFLKPPENIRDFQTAMPWAKDNGADIVACSDGGGRGLRIVGGLAIQPANWDATPKEVADAISTTQLGLDEYRKTESNLQGPREMGFSNLWASADSKPTTFYIKTRSGRIGVLQITGTSDGPAARYVRRASPGWHEITAHTVSFRYKLIVDDSQWSFAPAIVRQMHAAPDATPAGFLPAYSIRLSDGHLFRLPKNMSQMSDKERDQWLDETKVNLVIDCDGDRDQYQFRLRNVQLAPLPDDDWKTLSANDLRERFAKLKWNVPSFADSQQKDKGFYSIKMTAGMPPPMTFAYETADGLRGIFQFIAANGQTEPQVRYKQIQQAADKSSDASPRGEGAKSIDDSTWSFGPVVNKQLYTTSSRTRLAGGNEPLRFDNFLCLDDGHRFNMPPKFEEMSAQDREKWLSETKVNLAIDHRRATDQWEIKLRNIKFAKLPDEDWASLSGKELQERLPKLKWEQPAGADAELKEKGFYSLIFTAGMPPPMTFAFETSDGRRGVFQFSSSQTAGGADGWQVTIRYKQIQSSDKSSSSEGSPQSGDTSRVSPNSVLGSRRAEPDGEVPADPKPLPTTEAEKAIARLVLVFFEDRSRRAVPVVLVNARSQTLAIMATPANFVPDGAPLAVYRNMLEIPGRAPLRVNQSQVSTHELGVYPAPPGLTTFRPADHLELAVGDQLSAILSESSDELHVTGDAAKVVALGRSQVLKVPHNNYEHQFDNLIQLDRTLPEGTPVFKDGYLAGLTLLGSRFVGEKNNTSYVVPVERIAELCAKIEREGADASPPAAAPLADAIAKFNKTAAENPIGKDQPPLTEDEAITAIRWKVETEKDHGKLTERQINELRGIAEKRTLPPSARFNLITIVDGVDGERFKAWTIELRLPGVDGKDAVDTVHVIRRQLICQIDEAGKPIPLAPIVQADDNATPLAAAINGFNASHYTLDGIRQQPLTEEEVLATIRWWKTQRDQSPVTNHEFAEFQEIADTRQLPQGTEFELISQFQPVIGKHFSIWSVRLGMPRESKKGLRCDYDIRWQYVRSDTIEDSDIAWGAAGAGGLQAGVRLEPQGQSYAAGQQVVATIYYRNTLKQELDIGFPRLMTRGYYNKIIALDAAGKELPIEQTQDPAFPVGWLKLDLPPGSIHDVRGLPIRVGDVPRGDAETLIKAVDGQSVHLRFELPDLADKDANPLKTGEVVFTIADPSKAATGEGGANTTGTTWHSVNHFPTFQPTKVIACSPDGKRIAIGCDAADPREAANHFDGPVPASAVLPAVEVLDGGQCVSTFLQVSEEEEKLLAQSNVDFQVRAVAFSSDGNLLAIGTSIGQVELCDARTYKLIQFLDDHDARLTDKSVPEKLQEVKRAMGSIESLAFSPDGSLLATCGESFADAPLIPSGTTRLSIKSAGPGRVKIWDVKTGQLKHDLVGHSHVWAVAFSPDGNLLATAGNWFDQREHGTGIIIWNPNSGARKLVIATEANGSVNSVAFSPDSKLIAFGGRVFDKDSDTSTTSISLAHAGTGILEWKHIVPGWAKVKAFSPDGQSALVLCGGHSIRFYETATGRQQQEIRPDEASDGGLWNDFAIAKEAKILAIGGVDDKKRGSVTLWSQDGEAAAESTKPESPKSDRETDLKK